MNDGGNQERHVSRRCDLTGKRPNAGNRVSNANNKTKMRQYPNLQRKRIWVPELNRYIKVRASTRALRTIDKVGVMVFLKKNDLRIEDIT